MIVHCDSLGWINGHFIEKTMIQGKMTISRAKMKLVGPREGWKFIILDAHPTRPYQRVSDTTRVAKLHLLILRLHTTSEHQHLNLSVYAVLKSTLAGSSGQPIPLLL